MSTKMDSINLQGRALLILIFSLVANGVGELKQPQKSTEANCLVQGYRRCLANLSNSSSTQSAKSNECFRLSGFGSAASNRSSPLLCKDDQCPWNGACVQYTPNSDSYDLTNADDWPIKTYYEDVHTITISFPKYLNSTIFYILETRPVGDVQQPFRFAGVSNQTTISYHVIDICDRYEFRPTAMLANGSVITFRPKISDSNPPDFIVDNIRLSSLRADSQRNQVIAVLTWKHPYGYSNMDVDNYDSYLHTLQCDASSEILNEALTSSIVKTDEGGSLTATFPDVMVEKKCQFRLMVWAMTVCKNRTLTDAKVDIVLNCSTVQGYKCPAAELRPYCFSYIDVSPSISASASKSNVSVNISWTPVVETRPIYYHLRWGKARLLDLRRKYSGEVSSEEGAGSAGSQSISRSREGEDFAVWMLQPETVVQDKLASDTTFTILTNVSSNTAYGVQICAIFNGDFKRPEWQKVATNGFACSCADATCSSTVGLQCQQQVEGLQAFGTTSLPTIRPPLAMIRGVAQPPDAIDSVRDFTQTLVHTEPDGMRIRLIWKPPMNLLQQQILRYDASVETLLPCGQLRTCCDYAELTKIDQFDYNDTGIAELFLPISVINSHCRFVAKIVTIAINGATSITLNNILVPPFPVPTPLPVPQFGVPSSAQDSLNACQRLQCSHSCNATHCTCPADMTLEADGKSCDYQDPDVWNVTAGTPTSPPPSILCAAPGDTLFAWRKEGTLKLKWNSSSSELVDFQPDSNVRVRLGSVSKHSTDTVLAVYQLDDDATVVATALASGEVSLIVPPSSSGQLGLQFCVFDPRQLRDIENDSTDWDIVPVILLPRLIDGTTDQSDQNTIANQLMTSHSRKSNPHNATEAVPDPRTIAMAVVIPLSCVIIIASFLVLFCYFYAGRVIAQWTRQRGRQQSAVAIRPKLRPVDEKNVRPNGV